MASSGFDARIGHGFHHGIFAEKENDDGRQHQQHRHGGCDARADDAAGVDLLHHGGQHFHGFAVGKLRARHVPAADEGENHQRHPGGAHHRQDDFEEGVFFSRAVDSRRFQHVVRNGGDELAHQEHAEGGAHQRQDQRPEGVQHAGFRHQHVLGQRRHLGAEQDGEHDDAVDDGFAGEPELGHGVAGHGGQQDVSPGGRGRDKHAVEHIPLHRYQRLGLYPEDFGEVLQRRVIDDEAGRKQKQLTYRLERVDDGIVHGQRDENAENSQEEKGRGVAGPGSIHGFPCQTDASFAHGGGRLSLRPGPPC